MMKTSKYAILLLISVGASTLFFQACSTCGMYGSAGTYSVNVVLRDSLPTLNVIIGEELQFKPSNYMYLDIDYDDNDSGCSGNSAGHEEAREFSLVFEPDSLVNVITEIENGRTFFKLTGLKEGRAIANLTFTWRWPDCDGWECINTNDFQIEAIVGEQP